MKFRKLHHLWGKLVLTGLVIFSLVSCNTPDEPEYYELVKMDPSTGHLIDSLETRMWHYFAKNPDSSYYYLRLADSRVIDRTDMMLAQNNNYLADLMLVTGNLGTVEKTALTSLKILGNYKKYHTEPTQNIMLMTSVAAEQVVQKLKLDQIGKTRTINRQRWMILVFAMLTVLTFSTLITIFLLHKKLQHTYRVLVNQIQNSLKPGVETRDKKSTESLLYEQLAVQLEAMIVTQKPFLNKTLTLNDLAALLHTNQTYLSNFFNQNYKINFHDYINQLRVREACRLISLAEHQNLSIDHLANLSGFNSKSTFYTAFKKFTGMSPVVFIKNSVIASLK